MSTTEVVVPNKYDSNSVKQTLDDLVVDSILDTYKEDVGPLLVNTVLGVACVLAASAGQFLVPFPGSWYTMVSIIIFNLAITLFLNIQTMFRGSDVFFVTKSTLSKPNSLLVSSSIERFGINYTLSIRSKHNPSLIKTITKGANEWIRKDGSVDKDSFTYDVRQLLKEVEAILPRTSEATLRKNK